MATLLERFSLVNHLVTATVALGVPGTQDSAYPIANVLRPQAPMLPWRTTATTQQTIVFNLGSAKQVTVASLFNINYVTYRWQANATDAWGAPTYDSGDLTATQQDLNTRYQTAFELDRTFQFWRLVIQAQAPVDGAAFFATGGVWLGTYTSAPTLPRQNIKFRRREPREDVQGPAEEFFQRLDLGDPSAEITMERFGARGATTPLTADEIDQWFAFERQILVAPYFLYWLSFAGGASDLVWVMLRTSDIEFSLDGMQGAMPYVVRELMGP